jgi:hypothetical protein
MNVSSSNGDPLIYGHIVSNLAIRMYYCSYAAVYKMEISSDNY